MGKRFLQGFYEHEMLGEPSLDAVARQAFRQGLHLAMLGLAPEAHSIFALLNSHGLRPGRQWAQGSAISLFYHVDRNLASPFGEDPGIDDASSDDVAALQRVTMRFPASYVDDDGGGDYDLEAITEERYAALRAYAAGLRGEEHADATTGYEAVDVSAALVVLLYMADRLGKEDEVQKLLGEMSARIHANRQAEFFHAPLVAWERWFVPGGLRRALGIDEAELRTYADFVRETLQRRLENGPVQPAEIYKGWSVRQLLEELNKNTFSDPEFDPKDFYFDEEDAASAPTTIFKEPATEEAIQAKEIEMGRKLPDELRELFKVSDGCHPVKTSPGDRAVIFPPLEDIFVENDEYMDDYGFTILPDFEVTPERPSGVDELEWEYSFMVELCRYGGGIAVYEHDGQGTEYVWVIPKETLDAARQKVREVHGKVSDEQKERIEAEIVRRYGSKEVYEGMDCCIYTQGFACPEGQGVYPGFMSYLWSVVFDSRVSVDRSPVKGGKA